MSEAAVSYAFEPLEPSEHSPRDAAARMLAQAEAQADGIREQAFAQGHEEGLRQGHEEGRGQMVAAAQALAAALAGVEALRDEIAEAVERDAVELALALAAKILSAELEVRPELVTDVVQGALRRVTGQRHIAIVVNPADLEAVRAALGEMHAQTGGEPCDLQADQRVEAGGAIVRTAEGEVDARASTQLERAREVALAELERKGP